MEKITSLFVEKSCLDHPYTQEILQRVPNLPVQLLSEREAPPNLDVLPQAQAIAAGKCHLVLTRNRGRFLKPCPATREYTCCEYQVLNIGMNCPMDCVYCILQAYLNMPWLSFFVNVEDLFRELDEALAGRSCAIPGARDTPSIPSVADPTRFWRIGTGEFTDSLVLDGLTQFSKKIVPYMADKKNAVLELKTKTANIEHLQGLDHGGRTIAAWSLNSAAIATTEELKTATLDQRLAAAAKAAEWGYLLAFHFDPIIYHDNWREGYAATIKKLFAAVPRDRIAWISMGALRFLPALKTITANRFPGSRIFYEEFVPCPDGKMRYFHTRREELYSFLYGQLRAQAAPETCIYLCMESDRTWSRVFGFAPGERGGLPVMLEKAVREVMEK